ncbi:OmpH family outer membrane protein [Sulfitobacter sp. D35]|uniref:OmpH family outer membrane protein n=1 Tax=Sulfitobacter sp. D35 TaxID=3083252 RepID=UPI00296FA3BD|nr:OmpH family outer membrane protein [Sulfitobacter sp. D35]MDW4497738.1 OmpH family outer membrane protein [Sulfitobacter sp. D35]
MRAGPVLFAALLSALVGLGPAVSAQGLAGGSVHSPILTIDTERLFVDSDYGQKTTQELEARSAELAAENRRIEAELAAEEQDLTRRRPTMEPEAFRTLADAFDEKVQATRRAQEGKSRELTQEFEQRRVAFLNAAVPVLEALMRSAGAAVVLERRSIFLSANAIDITSDAISRVNDVLGDDADVAPTGGQAPGTAPAPEETAPPAGDGTE